MKIAHIADVHVKLNNRHDEYREVFQKLYKSLREEKPDIIVLAGDLFHSKNRLSPEAVALGISFLQELSKISKIFSILGNHDGLINQTEKLDSVSPIFNTIADMQDNEMKLADKSGIYPIKALNNEIVNFGVFSINDKEKWPKVIGKKYTDELYIALFHAPIDISSNDHGFSFKTSQYSMNMFDEYDYALLGDIHKYQILRYDQKGNANSAYSGSLIQQDFGEARNKGYIIWNTDDKTHKFIELENDYGFHTIIVDPKNISNPESISYGDVPKKPYFRLLLEHDNYDMKEKKALESYIKKTFKPEVFKTDYLNEIKKNNFDIDFKVEDVSQLPIQKKLLKEYFKTVDDSIKDKVKQKTLMKYHEDVYNETLSDDDVVMNRGTKWNIHKMDFSNTFSYGEGNTIDFDALRGIVGIFSPNTMGKSSLLCSLLVGFFNESSRTNKRTLSKAINIKKNSAHMKIEFSVDKKDYVLTRSITRQKNNFDKVKNTIELYEIRNGKLVDFLGEKSIAETEAFIKSHIGTFFEHKMTTFGLQNDLGCFIDLPQSQRKDLFSKFIGLDVFEKMFKPIKDERNRLKKLLDEYDDIDYFAELDYSKKTLKEIKQANKITEKEKNEIIEILHDKNEQIETLSATLKDINAELKNNNEEDVKEQIKSYKAQIKSLKDSISSKEKSLKDFEKQSKIIWKEVDQYNDINFLKEKIAERDELKSQLSECYSNKKLLEQKHLTNKKNVDILLKHDWFENTDVCKKCTFLTNAFESKDQLVRIDGASKKLDGKIEKLEKESSKYDLFYKELKDKESAIQRLNEHENSLQMQELNISNEKSKLETLKLKLNALENILGEFVENSDAIKFNLKVSKQVSQIKIDKEDLDKQCREKDKLIAEQTINIGKFEQKILDLDEEINKINDLHEKYVHYDLLKEAFSRDGIPIAIVESLLPNINKEIQKTLDNVVGFEVSLKVENDALEIYLIDSNGRRTIEQVSGMEKTVSAIAIRASLTNVSTLPQSNIFVIDEGFGSLDTDNLQSVNILLDRLKNMFNTVIIISHIDYMKDFVDTTIDIGKDTDGFSVINL